VRWSLQVGGALALTYALLDGYELIFHPPVLEFPYVVGLFSVIVSTLVLGAWPGVISLAASTIFFFYVILPSPHPK
jgi:hypothetical protein